jgi:hypothetical protein
VPWTRSIRAISLASHRERERHLDILPAAVAGVCRALVVVPSGRRKIWDGEPLREPTSAAAAYTGTPFRLNRQYAQRCGDVCVALSAKFGFIAPHFGIPESYEVSFKYPVTGPFPLVRLR